MQMIIYAWLVGAGLATCQVPHAPLERFQSAQVHMGAPFKIVFYADSQATANRAWKAAFQRIAQLDKCMSDYDSSSELLRLCSQAPMAEAVPVSDDLWHVLHFAQLLSVKTDGAFDATVGPFTRLWRRARRQKKMPPPERLAEARRAVGYRHLQLDEPQRAVRLLQDGMRLDLGGIAKGYAADEALKTLADLGIHRALVNGGGDIVVGQPPPGKPGWKVAIAPLDANAPPTRLLYLTQSAIATSGDTWQFVEIDGQRYSHIVDPRTGLGLTLRCSVTVLAPDGMTADALASAVTVLGPEKGLQLVEQTPAAAALMVVERGQTVQTFQSRRFPCVDTALPPGQKSKP